MADASSVRVANSLGSATGFYAGQIRYNGGEIWYSNGVTWQPLASRTATQTKVVTSGLVADAAFFIADKAYTVLSIKEVHAVADTDSGAVTLQVTKDTGTAAPGAGANLLTNNTNAGFDLKGTANTVQVGALTAVAADLTLAAGDRLALDFAGRTDADGVVVTVVLQAVADPQLQVTVANPTPGTDVAFFVADRAYQVQAVREVHSTKGTNGSAVTLQVTKDTGTAAPGAGTNLLTNNTNAGFDLKGDNNTVQVGTLSATPADLLLAAGDRLAIDFAGTTTAVAGVVVTVTLKAI